jgi:DNA-binding MarR family transcriptional regulator
VSIIRISDYSRRVSAEARPPDPVAEAAAHWNERYPDGARFAALTGLIRTYGTTIRTIDTLLRPLGLSMARFEVLLVLSFARRKALPMGRLRDALMVHGSSVTYLVDRLEAAGQVMRQVDPADRRRSLVRITPAGEEAVRRGCEALVGAGFGPLATLDTAELHDLDEMLGRVRATA